MAGPAYATGTILIAKNEDWQSTLQYMNVDPVDGTTIGPIDLTASRIAMQIRQAEEQHTALVTISTDDNSVALDDPVNGIFTLHIDEGRSALLPEGEFVADLIRTRTDGLDERLWEGIVTVNDGTTR
jgi:hypothetical protein